MTNDLSKQVAVLLSGLEKQAAYLESLRDMDFEQVRRDHERRTESSANKIMTRLTDGLVEAVPQFQKDLIQYLTISRALGEHYDVSAFKDTLDAALDVVVLFRPGGFPAQTNVRLDLDYAAL